MNSNHEWYRREDVKLIDDDGEFVTIKLHKSVYELARCEITGGTPEKDKVFWTYCGQNSDLYPESTESLARDDVPKGAHWDGVLPDCKTYPGVNHAFTVYVPAQYDGTRPANLYVTLDNMFRHEKTRIVMDNMIADGEIPVTIGLGIYAGQFNDPEYIGPGYPVFGNEHSNDHRSIEFDRVDNVLSGFLINEMMPFALQGLNVTGDPKKILISGNSSGGTGVFAAAYHRPDVFGNIWCSCGSVVGMRGGHLLATALRQHARRKFRAYISVGENDLNNVFGDRMTASWEIAKSMEYVGNDFILVINQGGHGDLYGPKELPDVLRWTWGSGALKLRHTRVFTGCAYPVRKY